MNADLTFALGLADVADGMTLPAFRAGNFAVETKEDLTPVTEIDRAVERALRDRIERERPGEAVVGEEYGAEAGEVRWILDPIDGTKNFVRGIPVFGTLIALDRGGELTLGVASAPALGRRWWAAGGEGAFADGSPIHVSKVDDLAEAQLCFGGLSGWRKAGRLDAFLDLAGRCRRTRGFGDFWMHLMVAGGMAEIAIENDLKPWDIAAVECIVSEAGGRMTAYDGAPAIPAGQALSTNGMLHDRMVRLLTDAAG